MNELKPCPFCGGEAVKAVYYSNNKGTRWSVHCLRGCVYQPKNRYKSREEAIEAWNRRMNDDIQGSKRTIC